MWFWLNVRHQQSAVDSHRAIFGTVESIIFFLQFADIQMLPDMHWYTSTWHSVMCDFLLKAPLDKHIFTMDVLKRKCQQSILFKVELTKSCACHPAVTVLTRCVWTFSCECWIGLELKIVKSGAKWSLPITEWPEVSHITKTTWADPQIRDKAPRLSFLYFLAQRTVPAQHHARLFLKKEKRPSTVPSRGS